MCAWSNPDALVTSWPSRGPRSARLHQEEAFQLPPAFLVACICRCDARIGIAIIPKIQYILKINA